MYEDDEGGDDRDDWKYRGPINPFERIRRERAGTVAPGGAYQPPGLEITAGGFEWTAVRDYRGERPLVGGIVGFVLGVPLIVVAFLAVVATTVAAGGRGSGDVSWVLLLPMLTAMAGAALGHSRATGVSVTFRLEGRQVSVWSGRRRLTTAAIEKVTVGASGIRVGAREFLLDESTHTLDWLREQLENLLNSGRFPACAARFAALPFLLTVRSASSRAMLLPLLPECPSS